MRKVLVVLLFLVNIALLFGVVVAGATGFEFWFDNSGSLKSTLAGLRLTIWFAGAMVPVTVLRWWLKSISWGTFSNLAFALAVGCFHFGTYTGFMEVANKQPMSGWAQVFWLLAVIFMFTAVFFFVRNILHVKGVYQEAKMKSGRR